MEVLELRGTPAFFAMQAFHKLMLGLKMLPAYFDKTYAVFYAELDALPSEDQEKYIREAAVFVRLEPEEIADLAQFVCDPNGVPYGPKNMKNLTPTEIHEIVVAVSLEIAKAHKVRILSEEQKKKLVELP